MNSEKTNKIWSDNNNNKNSLLKLSRIYAIFSEFYTVGSLEKYKNLH